MNTYDLIIWETEVYKETQVLNESLFNYGLTERAIYYFFGSKEKLTKQVEEQFKKKYKTNDISNLDPKAIEDEVNKKVKEATRKLGKEEFSDKVYTILTSGFINGVVNGLFNSLVTLITTLNPVEALKQFVTSFIFGFLIKTMFHAIILVYNEVKKRIYKDPFAQPSPKEILIIMVMTIAAFTTIIGVIAGMSAGAILVSILVNIFVSIVISLLMGLSGVYEKIGSLFKVVSDPKTKKTLAVGY